jgi:ketosteroid isomerase-like protein
MTQENVEAVRAIYERFSEGDFRTSVDLFDRHVRFLMLPDAPEAEEGAFLGVEGVATGMRRLFETWADLKMEAEELIAAGDTVLVSVRQHGVARISGVPTEAHYFTLWSFRGSKVILIENFRERAQALEAAGLSE